MMAFNHATRSLVQRMLVAQKITWHSRLCTIATPSGPSDLSSEQNLSVTTARIIPTTFSNGLFRFQHGQSTYVLHYWTPVKQIPDFMFPSSTTDSQPDSLSSVQDEMSVAPVTSAAPSVSVIDVTNNPVDIESQSLPLGHALKESSAVVIEGIGDGGEAIRLQLDGMVDPLRKWEAGEVPPAAYQNQILAQERQALMSSYQPMSNQFTQILAQAESQANHRFKWGGLFFLSAQLGFVARLTWFEYSWDIMEPITWCITYSLMISTFAYYVMTSQEFLLPLAEKREVQERFWKIANKNNFNINEFKRLRKQLLAMERKSMLQGGSGGSQTAFDRVLRNMPG